MARASDAIADNAAGDLFVDTSCIDCDLCRQLAPSTYARSRRASQSYVSRQPASDAEQHRALLALVTCPTSSIGMHRKLDATVAARAFPIETGVDDVLFCGYASAASYGAASWMILRPEGNVLVDSPRHAKLLEDRIAALGGVTTMVLTHLDDVADHAMWRERFGCERVIHRADVRAGTRDCEHIVDGTDAIALGDLTVIPVPGHTRGSIALLWRDVLFTGDHLWGSDDGSALEAGRDVCWYSWDEQQRSIAKLATYEIRHVLPGHGRPFHAPTAEALRAALAEYRR